MEEGAAYTWVNTVHLLGEIHLSQQGEFSPALIYSMASPLGAHKSYTS